MTKLKTVENRGGLDIILSTSITSGKDAFFSGMAVTVDNIFVSSAGGSIIIVIMLITVGVGFFRLLLEAAERYIVINLGFHFSPLAAATITSKNTSRIFWSYLKMILSQLMLMVFNVFFVRGATGMMKGLAGQDTYFQSDSVETAQGGILLWFIFLIAFLKAGQVIDSYMRSLGLDIAQTGRGVMDEITGTTRNMMFAMISAGRMSGGMKGILGRGGRGSAGSYAAREEAVNAANKGMAEHVANGTPLNASTMYNGIKNGTYASGETAKAAMNSVVPGINQIPGMDHAAVSIGNGKMALNLGNGRTGELSMTPPVNGKPYMTIPTANGSQMYLSNTGKQPFLSQIPKKGEQMGFQEAFGLNAKEMGEHLGLTDESMKGINVAGLGNNCMALTDEDGNILGTMVAQGADTNLAQGMGVELNASSMPEAGMIDDYRFIAAPNTGLADSDYVDAMISDSAGICYDSQGIVETLNDGRAADNCVIDTQMVAGADGAESLVATYADGTTAAMNMEQLSGYKLQDTSGYAECHGISDYMTNEARNEMIDHFYGGNTENANIASFSYDSKQGYANIRMTDGQAFRVYSGSEYSVNGNGSHVVDFAGTQGYAVEMNAKTNTPRNVEIHHRATADRKR